MKRLPRIIKAYDSLPRNPKYPLQEFRLRVVKYHNSTILLDIREYITSNDFNGYSPKGISLNREQLLYLAAQMHDIINMMREDTHNPNQLKLPLNEGNIKAVQAAIDRLPPTGGVITQEDIDNEHHN